MGQKVNPHGLRVGIIKDWDSRWYASDAEFSDFLVEDYNIRQYRNHVPINGSRSYNISCRHPSILRKIFLRP